MLLIKANNQIEINDEARTALNSEIKKHISCEQEMIEEEMMWLESNCTILGSN